MKQLLKELGIESANAGASDGVHWWGSSPQMDSVNPANGQIIASIHGCTTEDYHKVIVHSQAQSKNWQNVPAPKRGELVRQIGEELRAKKTLLGQLVSLESGKSAAEGLGEVQEMIDMADFAVGQSRMLYGKTMPSERSHHRLYEQWHPLGIAGVITAFNFPVAVWSWNAFLAAVCGNTVIWKPSPKTALCAIAVQKICNQVMIANQFSGIFSLMVTNEVALVQQFVADERIPLISFTGSTPVGRNVGVQVAQRLGRSLLELGGNNCIIIDENADLNLALRAVVFSAIGTNGQRCTTVRRLLIHDSIFASFLNLLVKTYRNIVIGDPLDTQTQMGPLIDADAVARYQAALSKITAAGGKILFGGKVLPGPGFFVEPTLVQAENHWEIVQQETFAPILYLIPFHSFEEAVLIQNQAPQGLASAVFTNDLRHSEYFLSQQGSDCGLANVNIGTSGAEIGGAFGGEKATGGGREAGSDAWKNYMRRQTVTVHWGKDLPLAQGIKFPNL